MDTGIDNKQRTSFTRNRNYFLRHVKLKCVCPKCKAFCVLAERRLDRQLKTMHKTQEKDFSAISTKLQPTAIISNCIKQAK